MKIYWMRNTWTRTKKSSVRESRAEAIKQFLFFFVANKFPQSCKTNMKIYCCSEFVAAVILNFCTNAFPLFILCAWKCSSNDVMLINPIHPSAVLHIKVVMEKKSMFAMALNFTSIRQRLCHATIWNCNSNFVFCNFPFDVTLMLRLKNVFENFASFTAK